MFSAERHTPKSILKANKNGSGDNIQEDTEEDDDEEDSDSNEPDLKIPKLT